MTTSDDHRLTDVVRNVAVLIDDDAAFRSAAASAVEELDSTAIESLAERFLSPPDAPPGFGSEERGLSGWLSAWQFAIFELFFNFREAALPVLRRVALGKYDWTQGNAIEVLCRLAALGIEREPIVTEIKREFPNLRYEAQIYAVRPLLAIADENAAVAEVVSELMQVDEFRETVEELTESRDEDRDNLMNEQLHGSVTAIQARDERKWSQHVIGAIFVDGLNWFSFMESAGKACLAVTTETRLQRLTNGCVERIDLTEIAPSARVAIGYFSFTEQTSPVTIYPESITLLVE